MKKIIAFYGSNRKNGNTTTLVNEIIRGFDKSNVEVITYNITDMLINPCKGCFACRKTKNCIIDDDMKDILSKIKDCDGIIFSSPIYMFQISGQMKQLMDRLYPLLCGEPGKYTLDFGIKKTVAIYTQGSPKLDSYKEYISHTNKSLNLLGFNVIETLICTSGNNLNSAFENNELMKTAHENGNLF